MGCQPQHPKPFSYVSSGLLPTLAKQRWRRPLTATRTPRGRRAPCRSASRPITVTSGSYSVVATSSSWWVLTAAWPWRSRGWGQGKDGQGLNKGH